MRTSFWLAVALGVVILGSRARADEKLPGHTIDEAKKTDLFTFFHLEQTASDTDADKHTVLTFKPTSPIFRPLVAVKVTLDAKERIGGMELVLARSFIDHQTNGAFARDIAKSMLHAIVSSADEKKMADLLNEIEFGLKAAIVNPNRKPPKLPETPTEGYQTFLGKRKSFEQDLQSGKLELKNGKDEKDADTLTISVRPKK